MYPTPKLNMQGSHPIQVYKFIRKISKVHICDFLLQSRMFVFISQLVEIDPRVRHILSSLASCQLLAKNGYYILVICLREACTGTVWLSNWPSDMTSAVYRGRKVKENKKREKKQQQTNRKTV